MKKLTTLLIILVAFIRLGYCTNPIDKNIPMNEDTVAIDTIEYDLIVTDLGFDSYLATQLSADFYTEDYYKQWNNRYVIEWNNRYRSGPDRHLYENDIMYDYRTSYGIDFEHKLYHYFRFFEKTNNVKLVPRVK